MVDSFMSNDILNIFKSLHHACHKGHMKTVQKLLRLGADPFLFTVDYRYPGDLAESAGFNNVNE
jgi:hypothetical protein